VAGLAPERENPYHGGGGRAGFPPASLHPANKHNFENKL